MKKILTILLLSAATLSVSAQDKDNGVPQNYKLEKPADYTTYEKNVIQCVDWIMATPYNAASPQQQAANAFLIQWVSGSPELKLAIVPGVVNFHEANPSLLLIFMGGWARYAIESRKFDDKLNGNLKGVEAVISYYEQNKDKLKEDKHVEDYAAMQKKKTLKSYIEKNM